MSRVELKPGMFSWVDLITPHYEKQTDFYTALFGWTAVDAPMPEGRRYRTFALGDDVVAGIGEAPPGSIPEGVPPMWTSYILVEDIAATAGRATELGGTVLMPPSAVGEEGHMALIQDPTGAVVALWQAGRGSGATLFNEPGTLSWNELVTKKPLEARAFYDGLLGWGWEEAELERIGTYHMCMVDGRPNGGICNPPQVPDEVPSYWDVYFGTDDVDATVERALELGGKVLVPPMTVSVGRWAAIQDPGGTVFSLFKPAEEGEG